MNDLIFDMCCVMVFCSGFAVMLGIFNWVFEFACRHIPAFDTWVNNFIGVDDDEWESEE